jgi:hypothetical protein
MESKSSVRVPYSLILNCMGKYFNNLNLSFALFGKCNMKDFVGTITSTVRFYLVEWCNVNNSIEPAGVPVRRVISLPTTTPHNSQSADVKNIIISTRRFNQILLKWPRNFTHLWTYFIVNIIRIPEYFLIKTLNNTQNSMSRSAIHQCCGSEKRIMRLSLWPEGAETASS